MAYKDKEKQQAAWRRWYYNHYDQANKSRNDRKQKIKEWYREYKTGRACTRCPEKDPVCLDFHHPDSDKDFNIADAVAHGWSIKKIADELVKCIVLCSNCHRKEHAKLRAGVIGNTVDFESIKSTFEP